MTGDHYESSLQTIRCCKAYVSLQLITDLVRPFLVLKLIDSQDFDQVWRIRPSRGTLWSPAVRRFLATKSLLRRQRSVRPQRQHTWRISDSSSRQERKDGTLAGTLHTHGGSWRMHLCEQGSERSAVGCGWSDYCRQYVLVFGRG